MALGVSQANAQTIYLTDITAAQGETVLLPISLYTGSEKAITMQVNIMLPNGMVADCDHISQNSERIADQLPSVNIQEDGSYRIISFTNSNSPSKGTDGELIYVPVTIGKNVPFGKYTVTSFMGEIVLENLTAVKPNESTATITVLKPADPIAEPEDFQFYSPNVVISKDTKNVELDLMFDNSETVKAFAFDIVLPDNVSVIQDEEEEYFIYNDERCGRYLFVEGKVNGNIFNVKGEATKTASYVEPDKGQILTITLSIGDIAAVNDIKFTNQTVTKSDGSIINPKDYTAELSIEATPEPTVNDIKVIKGVKPDGDLGDNEIALDENNNWHARKITLADGVKFDSDHLIDVAEFSLVRSFPHQNWQAWFAPFAVSSDIFAQAINFVGTKVDGDETVLVFEEVTGELEPNTPYIIRPNGSGDQGETSKALTGIKSIKLQKSEAGSTPATKYTLCGTYTEKTDMATSGAYALKDGNFHPASSDAVTLKPFRIYLQANEGSAAEKPSMLRIMVEGDVEGIESVENDSDWDGTYYDLQGRPVQNSGKGLYIMKGKKVYIK